MTLLTRALLGTVAAAAMTTAAAADVEFMTWTYTEDSGRDTIQAMLDTFTGQTGIAVEPIGIAWGDMVKNTFLRARTDTLPDISQVQGRLLPTVANIDGIVDLNDVFGREALLEMYSPTFLAAGEVGGKQVGLPWIGGTIGMVANQKVMDAAGIDGAPTTVEEFRADLELIRNNVPNSVPYGLATKNNASILLDYLIWTWTFGGDVLVDGKPAVNSPEAVEALAFMAGLVEDRLAAPEIDRPDARRLFGQEAMGFYFDAPSAKKFAADFSGQGDAYTVNIVPMETPVMAEGDESVSIQWGHVMAMYGADNASPDSEAAKFLMYLVSDDVLIDYAVDGGVLPTTIAGQASARVQDDAYLAAWSAAAVAPRRNSIASLVNGSAVQDIIGEEVQAAILGQKTAQEAADDMQARLMAEIE